MQKSGAPAEVTLSLPDGDTVVLVQMLGSASDQEEVNRNVCRCTARGKVLWRIQSVADDGERQPFTNISLTDTGRLTAYNWNGGEYLVDLETGDVGKGILVR
ncbi:hypothetical protein [Phenylobacterium sp.]|uniref:hypothetical protein n=1 Tax=Phenylobacterium sp. TaxID=1871053 RepID=UPI003BA9546A